jgi:hypothetical protein
MVNRAGHDTNSSAWSADKLFETLNGVPGLGFSAL